MDSDQAVQATNDDAQQSKASCVSLGYFQDDFVHFFVKTAGFDTTYFQAKSQGGVYHKWVELDFAEVTMRKVVTIEQHAELKHVLEAGNVTLTDITAGSIVSPEYALLPCDLRRLDQVDAALTKAGLDPTMPTCFLAECVLVYMAPGESDALLSFLAERFPTAAVAIYEQIQPDTQFGRQMVKNLEARGAPLLGLHATPSLEAHRTRLTRCGWRRAFAEDLNTIYRQHVDPLDRVRAEALEVFDEFEEWHLIMAHYCVAVGVNDAPGLLDDFAFREYEHTEIAAAKPPQGGAPVVLPPPSLPKLPNTD